MSPSSPSSPCFLSFSALLFCLSLILLLFFFPLILFARLVWVPSFKCSHWIILLVRFLLVLLSFHLFPSFSLILPLFTLFLDWFGFFSSNAHIGPFHSCGSLIAFLALLHLIFFLILFPLISALLFSHPSSSHPFSRLVWARLFKC